ncbi:helix-turn-helix domain-containing protein [Phaeobacter sp. HF9A]|uniref:AraC-like ligand-binding domain-containing protein n=1 Tax=Phaeobacter sp. HF9A TaxID=2721561 RepID=UPI001430FC51|nr:helix-turn-helix domain-containing protein [Phaeobacter sp. HF9A]NIZ12130.1 helix-turn-helix domain-containing protein [Phaeobacter sp. HF9A]
MWDTWREQLWSRFVRLDSSSSDEGFFGHVIEAVPGSKRLSAVYSTTQITERTPVHIRRDPQDYALVALQLEGQGFIEQDGRQTRLDAGDFGCYLTERPYRLGFDSPFRQLILRLPRERLAEHFPCLSQVTARRFNGRARAGLLAAGFIRQMAENGGGLAEADLANMETVTAQMLATAMQQDTEGQNVANTSRLERVQRSLRDQLRDPDLDLSRVAAQQGMSLRTLQRLFQCEGLSPTQWVAEQRLQRVASLLRDPAQAKRSITDIALSCGFGDLSHFSRAFRQRYGASAREWRRLS